MLTNLQQHVDEFSSVLTNQSLEDEISFFKKIKQPSKISPQLAIDIYRNNTRGARINALKVVYPACVNILGDSVFHSIAKEFVDADVIGTSDLNHYGIAFDQHLRVFVEVGRLPVEYNYLSDLARLEYCFHAAYYADDDLIFDFELFEVNVQKEQQVYFEISKSLALLTSQKPIEEIWINNHKDTDLEENNVQAITKTQYLVIHRDDNTPKVTTINYCEYQLLDAFIKNHSLQSVIETIDCDVETILPVLIAKRWLTGIKRDE